MCSGLKWGRLKFKPRLWADRHYTISTRPYFSGWRLSCIRKWKNNKVLGLLQAILRLEWEGTCQRAGEYL